MDTHEVLVAARNLIDREGWADHARGGDRSPTGPQCAGLACTAAAGEWGGVSLHAVVALQDVVGEDLYQWNDTPGRTKEEVLAAFDKAIAETAPAPMDPFIAGPVGRASFREKVS